MKQRKIELDEKMRNGESCAVCGWSFVEANGARAVCDLCWEIQFRTAWDVPRSKHERVKKDE